MLISAKLIKNPKIRRICSSCEIYIYGEQLRLYGAAHSGDPPYTTYVHKECVGFSGKRDQKKIEDALSS
jgi:hypothetical protein